MRVSDIYDDLSFKKSLFFNICFTIVKELKKKYMLSSDNVFLLSKLVNIKIQCSYVVDDCYRKRGLFYFACIDIRCLSCFRQQTLLVQILCQYGSYHRMVGF